MDGTNKGKGSIVEQPTQITVRELESALHSFMRIRDEEIGTNDYNPNVKYINADPNGIVDLGHLYNSPQRYNPGNK